MYWLRSVVYERWWWRCAVGRVLRAEEFARWWWGSVHVKGVKGKRYFFVACIHIIIYCVRLRRCRHGSSRKKQKRSVGLTRAIPPSGPPRSPPLCYAHERECARTLHSRPLVEVWGGKWQRCVGQTARALSRSPENRTYMLGGGWCRFGDRREEEKGSYARSMCVRLRTAAVRANGSASNMAAAVARAHDRANSARPIPGRSTATTTTRYSLQFSQSRCTFFLSAVFANSSFHTYYFFPL